MNSGFFVSARPEWKGRIERWPMLKSYPPEYRGVVSLSPNPRDIPAVFIDQVDLGSRELYLFGFKISQPSKAGKADSYICSYCVVEYSGEKNRALHLHQYNQPVYHSKPNDGESVWANEIKKAELQRYCPFGPPKWKTSDAMWPTIMGKPMRFLRQARLVDNDVTRLHLSVGETVFLFDGKLPSGRATYTVFEQDLSWQTASDHYRSESERLP